jgi:hypothetical protein
MVTGNYGCLISFYVSFRGRCSDEEEKMPGSRSEEVLGFRATRLNRWRRKVQTAFLRWFTESINAALRERRVWRMRSSAAAIASASGSLCT